MNADFNRILVAALHPVEMNPPFIYIAQAMLTTLDINQLSSLTELLFPPGSHDFCGRNLFRWKQARGRSVSCIEQPNMQQTLLPCLCNKERNLYAEHVCIVDSEPSQISLSLFYIQCFCRTALLCP